MTGGIGSTSNPLVMFPFDTVKEVHWKTGAIVLVETSAPITLYPDVSLGIPPALQSVSGGKYLAGTNIPQHGTYPLTGYDDVTFLVPKLDDGSPSGVTIQTILSQFTRPMQTVTQISDIGFGYRSAVVTGRTRWQTYVWDHFTGPPLPNTDIYSYKFTDHLIDEFGQAFDQAHAPYNSVDPPEPWQADAITTQYAARFTIATLPLLINMDAGANIMTKTIRVTQGPIFDAAPFPNLTASDYPATRIRSYRSGTWLVSATDVTNVGGKLIWDHSIPVAPFTTSEIPLGTFTADAFTPPS